MSQKLDELTKTRKWAHRKLIEKGSKVYQAFTQLETVTFSDGALKKKEKELIIKALTKNNNKRKYAARDLGISERTLYRKIKQYEIEDK